MIIEAVVRERLAQLSLDRVRKLAADMARLEGTWPMLERRASAVFRPLLAPARYKAAYGGRGSGKSHFFAEMAVARCMSNPGTRIVCVREVQKSLRESVKLLIEDKIRHLKCAAEFEVRQDMIRSPGGGLIVFNGMQDHTAESIKSLEGFDVAYVEEAQTLTARSLELLRPTIREKGSELWFSWNPRHDTDPVDQLLRRDAPPDAVVVQSNYRDNPWFPAELERERIFDYSANPQRYRHIWLGEYEPQAIGAIWNQGMINRHRTGEPPPMARILVGVDPAVSAEKGSNETGIVAAGIGNDGIGYVLEDQSCVGSPDEWARRAVRLYDRLDADAIVVEVNQGGDMCHATLTAVRPGLPVIEVRATRGKHVRAEPISALYEEGKIRHVGAFPELEHEMCLMTADGYQGAGSPDRVDALVWVMTSLFKKLTMRDRGMQARFGVNPSTIRRMLGRKGEVVPLRATGVR